jgi:hypothetical protein
MFVSGVSMDMNIFTGAFGFLNLEIIVYAIFAVGLIGAVMLGSYVYAIKYVSPIALCTAFLFEPLVSQTVGCLLNIDKLPGILTLLGTSIVLFGLYYVSKGGAANKQEKQVK